MDVLGAGAIPTDHPLNVGMLGMHGNYGPNVLTNECDVLIAIGMRFDDRVTGRLDKYAKQAKCPPGYRPCRDRQKRKIHRRCLGRL
jgi:thiamine pyrophosphate-dependent acetolactate synthase large subunit-like protein